MHSLLLARFCYPHARDILAESLRIARGACARDAMFCEPSLPCVARHATRREDARHAQPRAVVDVPPAHGMGRENEGVERGNEARTNEWTTQTSCFRHTTHRSLSKKSISAAARGTRQARSVRDCSRDGVVGLAQRFGVVANGCRSHPQSTKRIPRRLSTHTRSCKCRTFIGDLRLGMDLLEVLNLGPCAGSRHGDVRREVPVRLPSCARVH
jgi:hypothetical protein